MNATAAPRLSQIALGDLEHELATTRRVLDRIPDEHLGWKPHAKSATLGWLATHIATLPYWGIMTIQQDELDFAQPMPPTPEVTSRDELLSRFDEAAGGLRAELEGTSDAALRQSWTLRNGEHVIFTLPRVGVLRGFVVSHMVHHRAQLGMYLRLLDLPVPSTYGPSADEASA